MDSLTSTQRSEQMSRVRGRDTKPEWIVRKMVHAMGFRYRLHVAGLPGTPDIVFRGKHKIIFVHGCFWHRHGKCKNTRWPKSRLEFWKPKLEANKARDAANNRALRRLGWEVLIIWECQLKKPAKIAERIARFMTSQ